MSDTATILQLRRQAVAVTRRGARAVRPQRRREQSLQEQVAQHLDLALRDPQTYWTAFPAGGGGKARGGQLKAMGLKAGFPDLLIIHAGRVLLIELKADADRTQRLRGGRTSAQQDKAHEALRMAGCWTVICRSLIEVQHALIAHHVPLSAQVMA